MQLKGADRLYTAMPNTWDETINTRSYDKVEAVSNFKTSEDVDKYCKLQVMKSVSQAAFIKEVCFKGKKLRVLEYCSGNSRLLYTLNAGEILSTGIGIEISKTRYEFAESWRKRLGLESIQNINGDAIDVRVVSPCVDVALCVTGAFQYMFPRSSMYDTIFMHAVRRSLVPGGHLILELYNHPTPVAACMMSDTGEYRSWYELPESDPFRYYLTHYNYIPATKTLDAKEIFVRRDGWIDDSKREVLRLYSPSEITDLLETSGFKTVGFFGGWDSRKADALSDKNVIVGMAV